MTRVEKEQIIKDFLFTAKEYNRFKQYFAQTEKHDLLDTYTEGNYIAIQTKLMLLRKYSYIRERVYLPNVLETARELFADIEKELSTIKESYDNIEKNHLETILSDGVKLPLYELQECVVYGVYLHADSDKIQKMLKSNEMLFFSMTRKYVEDLELVLFQIYDLLNKRISEQHMPYPAERAPVTFVGDRELCAQEIKGSPFWSNLYGKDATDEDLFQTISQNSREDMKILSICLNFFNELEKEDYSIKCLEKYIFPPSRRDWGDFSELKTIWNNRMKNYGWSSKVRYNDKHNEAYVHLYPNVKEAFIFNQPHVVTGLSIITLVNKSKKYDWRIFSIMDNDIY